MVSWAQEEGQKKRNGLQKQKPETKQKQKQNKKHTHTHTHTKTTHTHTHKKKKKKKKANTRKNQDFKLKKVSLRKMALLPLLQGRIRDLLRRGVVGLYGIRINGVCRQLLKFEN